MRTYKLKPGTRSRFLEIFQTKSVPAHDAIGMKILGPFLSKLGRFARFIRAQLFAT